MSHPNIVQILNKFQEDVSECIFPSIDVMQMVVQQHKQLILQEGFINCCRRRHKMTIKGAPVKPEMVKTISKTSWKMVFMFVSGINLQKVTVDFAPCRFMFFVCCCFQCLDETLNETHLQRATKCRNVWFQLLNYRLESYRQGQEECWRAMQGKKMADHFHVFWACLSIAPY